ncbi:hypothetical protein [uncultured Campylobacter sp.]|uniref:hypothetical protein n=1 Tax=uncultured Campylobacter sp. TaxID=218934 RepID=UPI0026128CEE|nr:hypothetical protein [uncultured Campylobacter sp.]
MDKILNGAGKINGADKISSVAGACGSAINLKGYRSRTWRKNGSFDRYRFELT